jgi:hypothetical protein
MTQPAARVAKIKRQITLESTGSIPTSRTYLRHLAKWMLIAIAALFGAAFIAIAASSIQSFPLV